MPLPQQQPDSARAKPRVAVVDHASDPGLERILAHAELAEYEFIVPAKPPAPADALTAVVCAVDADSAAALTQVAAVASSLRGCAPILLLAPSAEVYFDLAEAVPEIEAFVPAPDLAARTLRRALRLAVKRGARRAQQRESEQRYKRLYENSGVPIYELDLDGKLRSANPGMVELLGYSSEAELKQVDIGREHFMSAAERTAWFDLLRRKTRLVRYRKSMKTRAGRRLELLDTTYLVYDDAGNPVGYQGSVIDFTEVHELSQQLAYETNHDSLTSLPNRRAFEYQLEQAIEDSRTNDAAHALCYLDLDQFKVVNDTFGHAAGDELLRKLAGVVAARISSFDTLARVGGDEFAVLLRNQGIERSAAIANELLDTIRGCRLVWGERNIDVGASIGVVPIDESTASLSDLLSAADAACFAAKEKGRNRVHVQEPDDKTINRRISEMRLVVEAKHALQEERMRLFHQPIRAVPLTNGDPIRFEILIRMLGWDGALVSPGLFLPAIEKYNLSKTVDCWVIDHFLAWMVQTPSVIAKLEFGSINISGLSLGDADFLAHICAQLDAHEISGDKLCFEITETAAIQNFAAAQSFIATLRTRGCRFALDDFGSGTSSFGYLKNLLVDCVKIDGMFVRALRHSQTDRVIVKSINDVAHSMGLLTTAEFVEDEETLAIVTDIGVDFAQGYAVGLPQPLPMRAAPGGPPGHEALSGR